MPWARGKNKQHPLFPVAFAIGAYLACFIFFYFFCNAMQKVVDRIQIWSEKRRAKLKKEEDAKAAVPTEGAAAAPEAKKDQ